MAKAKTKPPTKNAARKKPRAKKKVIVKTPGLKQPRGTRWMHIRDAAQFGTTKDVQLFLDAGWPVDQVDVSATALGMACFHKKVAIVKQLLAAGADPNLRLTSTPLVYAVTSKSKRAIDMVEMLLAAGADPDPPAYQGTSLIQWIENDVKLSHVHAALVAAKAARRER